MHGMLFFVIFHLIRSFLLFITWKAIELRDFSLFQIWWLNKHERLASASPRHSARLFCNKLTKRHSLKAESGSFHRHFTSFMHLFMYIHSNLFTFVLYRARMCSSATIHPVFLVVVWFAGSTVRRVGRVSVLQRRACLCGPFYLVRHTDRSAVKGATLKPVNPNSTRFRFFWRTSGRIERRQPFSKFRHHFLRCLHCGRLRAERLPTYFVAAKSSWSSLTWTLFARSLFAPRRKTNRSKPSKQHALPFTNNNNNKPSIGAHTDTHAERNSNKKFQIEIVFG